MITTSSPSANENIAVPQKTEQRSITMSIGFTFLSFFFWGGIIVYSLYLVEMAHTKTDWLAVQQPTGRMPPRHWKWWKALAQRQNHCLRKRQHKRRCAHDFVEGLGYQMMPMMFLGPKFRDSTYHFGHVDANRSSHPWQSIAAWGGWLTQGF